MKTRFIAEVSSNHFQDLDRCRDFIETAAKIGCWGVKFQLFKIEELFAPEILEKSATHRNRKAWELPVSFIPEIAACCNENNIAFGCTPFYLEGVAQLAPYVDFLKIASYEMLWKALFSTCADIGKPLMMSTGMAIPREIENAVRWIANSRCPELTVFHCVSGYPTPVAECNLKAMETLRNIVAENAPDMATAVGWSDHSVNAGVIYRAVHKWSAEVVEFHLDIDGKGEEYDAGHCWLPEEMAPVIATVHQGLSADGTGEKKPVPAEEPDRVWRADPEDGLRPLKPIRNQYDG